MSTAKSREVIFFPYFLTVPELLWFWYAKVAQLYLQPFLHHLSCRILLIFKKLLFLFLFNEDSNGNHSPKLILPLFFFMLWKVEHWVFLDIRFPITKSELRVLSPSCEHEVLPMSWRRLLLSFFFFFFIIISQNGPCSGRIFFTSYASQSSSMVNNFLF